VAAQRDEPFRLGPVTPLQHPGDGELEIVVTDPPRHAAGMVERALAELLDAACVAADAGEATATALAPGPDPQLDKRALCPPDRAGGE